MPASLTLLFSLLLLALPPLLTSSLSGARPLWTSLLLFSGFPKLSDLVAIPLPLCSGSLPALHFTLALGPLVSLGEEGGQARCSTTARARPLFLCSRSVGCTQTFVEVQLQGRDMLRLQMSLASGHKRQKQTENFKVLPHPAGRSLRQGLLGCSEAISLHEELPVWRRPPLSLSTKQREKRRTP